MIDIPIFRARGIIGGIGPVDLMRLFWDSGKVKNYNKFSEGRRDICVFGPEAAIITKNGETETGNRWSRL